MNEVHVTGRVMKTWTYQGDFLARVGVIRPHWRPAKANGGREDYISVRFVGGQALERAIPVGAYLEAHGFLQSRDWQESLLYFLRDAGAQAVLDALGEEKALAVKAPRATVEVVVEGNRWQVLEEAANVNEAHAAGRIYTAWTNAGDLFVRIGIPRAAYRPPKADGGRVDFVNVRFPGGAGLKDMMQRGKRLEAHGFLQHRDWRETLARFVQDAGESLETLGISQEDGKRYSVHRVATEIVVEHGKWIVSS